MVDASDVAVHRGALPRFAAFVSAAAALGVALLSVRVAVRHAGVTPALADAHGSAPGRLRIGRVLIAGQTAVAFALVLGGILAARIVPLLGSHLYGIGVYDGSTWALTVAVIASTATFGALIPAWRASRVDPAGVLRGE